METTQGNSTKLGVNRYISRWSGRDSGRGLSLSEVIQKATIEVDEAGSEAAAATGGLTMFKSANLDNDVLSFKADHPFLFSLRDIKTGLLLFRGRVSDPSK